jgi:DNA polymerase II small subunit/DNA polymerase delta subunit B
LQITKKEKCDLGEDISVLMIPWSHDTVRFVFHQDIPTEAVQKVVKKFEYVLRELGPS